MGAMASLGNRGSAYDWGARLFCPVALKGLSKNSPRPLGEGLGVRVFFNDMPSCRNRLAMRSARCASLPLPYLSFVPLLPDRNPSLRYGGISEGRCGYPSSASRQIPVQYRVTVRGRPAHRPNQSALDK